MGCTSTRSVAARDCPATIRTFGTCRASLCARPRDVSSSSLELLSALLMVHSTSASVGNSTRQKLVIQGFADSRNVKTLSTIKLPLAPPYHALTRPIGFMPSAASLVFHPVGNLRLAELTAKLRQTFRLRWWSPPLDSRLQALSDYSDVPHQDHLSTD